MDLKLFEMEKSKQPVTHSVQSSSLSLYPGEGRIPFETDGMPYVLAVIYYALLLCH